MNITLLLVWPFCVFFFFLQSAGLRFLPFVYASLTSGCLILERVDDLDGNSCLRLHPTSTTLGFGWNTAAAAVEVSWHFQGAVPGWDPVSIRQFSRWRLLNPHFLPSSPLLSSLCLSALKTWLGPFCKHSCLFLFSKPCIVFDYRCLKIFFLLNCCHGSVVFFFSHSHSVATAERCSYPIKCHHTRWASARTWMYIRLPIKLMRATTKSIQSVLCSLSCNVCFHHFFHSWETH